MMNNIKNINKITINKTDALYTPVSNTKITDEEIALFLVNIYELGYLVNEKLYEAIQQTDNTTLSQAYEALNETKGNQYDYIPLDSQFDTHSYINNYNSNILSHTATLVGTHTLNVASQREEIEVKERDFTVLSVADDKDIEKIITQLVNSSRPFSKNDKNDIITLSDFINTDDIKDIKVKENLVYLTVNFPDIDFSDSYKTSTDVLRLAVAFSDGDISLANKTRFKLSRPQRKTVLSLLDRLDDVQGMGAYNEQWKRLATVLHYNEYADRYPQAAKQLKKIQNDEYITLNSYIESLIVSKQYVKLEAFPSVFARRLAEIIHKNPQDSQKILQSFRKASTQVSIPVLISMYNLFSSPDKDKLSHRLINIKNGEVSNTHLIENNLDNNYDDIYIEIIDIINNALSSKKTDTKVAFSDTINQYTFPLHTHNISEGTTPIPTGSQLELGNKNIIRLFMHWKNFDNVTKDTRSILLDDEYYCRVDLDLSAVFLDKNFNICGSVSFTHLNDGDIAYHSGDIVDAPQGATEFIDIDISKALANGCKYAVPTVYNYTRQPMKNIPESYTGFMMRDDIQSGELFEPSTVQHGYSINNGALNSTPYIIDLENRKVIWLDTTYKPSYNRAYSVDNNISNFEAIAKYAILTNFFTVQDYFNLTAHVIDDIELLTEEEKEEVIIINPSNITEVLSYIEL